MNTAPCDRLITPSTPKTSVKPSANSAYTLPSDSALTSCCSSIAAGACYFSMTYLPSLVTLTIAACLAS